MREVILLTGNNGQQISAQVSPGPHEACLIQLEPRWARAANDLMREWDRERELFFFFFFIPEASLCMIHNSGTYFNRLLLCTDIWLVHMLLGLSYSPTASLKVCVARTPLQWEVWHLSAEEPLALGRRRGGKCRRTPGQRARPRFGVGLERPLSPSSNQNHAESQSPAQVQKVPVLLRLPSERVLARFTPRARNLNRLPT